MQSGTQKLHSLWRKLTCAGLFQDVILGDLSWAFG